MHEVESIVEYNTHATTATTATTATNATNEDNTINIPLLPTNASVQAHSPSIFNLALAYILYISTVAMQLAILICNSCNSNSNILLRISICISIALLLYLACTHCGVTMPLILVQTLAIICNIAFHIGILAMNSCNNTSTILLYCSMCELFIILAPCNLILIGDVLRLATAIIH